MLRKIFGFINDHIGMAILLLIFVFLPAYLLYGEIRDYFTFKPFQHTLIPYLSLYKEQYGPNDSFGLRWDSENKNSVDRNKKAIIVILDDEQKFYDLDKAYKKLPIDLQAKTLKDLGLVVFVSNKKRVAGQYEDYSDAYALDSRVIVIDIQKSKVLGVHTFSKGSPSEKIVGAYNSSDTADEPVDKIAEYVVNFYKQ